MNITEIVNLYKSFITTVDILPTRTPNNIFNGRGKEHRDKAGGRIIMCVFFFIVCLARIIKINKQKRPLNPKKKLYKWS